jgi:putative endonuclease
MQYFVYIIKSQKDGSYYMGHTQDLDSRLQRHNQGRVKYTESRRPWELAYIEKYSDRSSAMVREEEIKERKSKEFIDSLVRTSRQS